MSPKKGLRDGENRSQTTEGNEGREFLLSAAAFTTFLILGSLFLLASRGTFAAKRAVATEFILVHSNDTWGYLTPCG